MFLLHFEYKNVVTIIIEFHKATDFDVILGHTLRCHKLGCVCRKHSVDVV